MKKVTTKAEKATCCANFTTAQCCSKASKVVAGCHN